MSDLAIETHNLTKHYNGTKALDGLNLSVEIGETYGFIGPNGAGKSTTIGLLMDYLRPTSGSATVLGYDPYKEVVALHRRVGILPDPIALYEDLTGRRHLQFVIDTKDVDNDPVELLERVGLSDSGEQTVGDYSQGMKQRLGVAISLVGDPELLILDEPFTGLDPHGVREVREIVHQESEHGTTVFFSSHVLDQVERVCDRVGILYDGELVAEGELRTLRKRVGLDSDASAEDIFIEYTNASRSVIEAEDDSE